MAGGVGVKSNAPPGLGTRRGMRAGLVAESSSDRSVAVSSSDRSVAESSSDRSTAAESSSDRSTAAESSSDRSVAESSSDRSVAVSLVVLLAVVVTSGCSHTVALKSEPPGATVTLDGEKVGKTPYTFDASSGFFDEHQVRVEHEGYESLETSIVQAEPIWGIVGPSVCLAPPTLGLSCLGLSWGFRYAKAYEFELSLVVERGDGGLDTSEAEDPKDQDAAQAIPY